MNRRQYLVASGVAGASAMFAGCLSGNDEYDVYETNGQEVPLAPAEDTYEWYEDDEAIFLDARSPMEYVQGHIAGALLSPAGDSSFDHPTDDISTDQRLVTYCVCPHDLAGTRAAELMNDGFEDVYAIDEGLLEWRDNGYPMDSGGEAAPTFDYHVAGRTDQSFAGEQVWLEELETGQRYVAHVGDDGRFEMEFTFYDVDAETAARLDLPDRSVERTLGELSDGELRF
ncbi:rhodanese-like domain-containing protein [Halovivax gelatinilyticus]|uniref:rhodanese-like domain-containing protein n=1 Tax=Halovivax gelatinilyticus TaxID=2961597 RepID=UPI0020CA391B|nr:rhodanese-like domain-containing protein [Halovivax gelatinilyticus]